MALLAWSPLASGLLADGFDLATLHPEDLRRRLPWAQGERDRTERARDAVCRIAAVRDTTMVHVALSWLCDHDGDFPIVGTRTPAEAGVFALTPIHLDDDARRAVETAST